jgi:rhamnosyl/mannosyltransferase
MEMVLKLLCEGERQYVDNHVLVANNRPVTIHEEVQGVPVTRVASYGMMHSVAICPTFPMWWARQQADIMVIHEPNPLGMLSYCLVRPPGKLVVWFHSEVIRQRQLYALHRPFLRRVLRWADRIIVSSPRLAEQAAELQDYQNKCVVVPFGVDPARLQRTSKITMQVAELHNKYDGPIYLFVGRMVGYKGVEILIRALPGLPGKAIFVGEGPLLSRMQHLAADLGLEERAIFTGDIESEELIALYHACDVLVLPSVSRNEAFGVVQIEAMTCGKPVVSTNIQGSGVPWVNRHEETGLVVPAGDVAALHGALEQLLHDPALRASLGAQGRQRVMTEFTLERMVSRMLAVYQDVTSAATTSLAPLCSSAIVAD